MNHSSPEKNYVTHLAAFEKSFLLRNFHRQMYEMLQIKHTCKGVCCYFCLQQLNTKSSYPDDSWQNLDPLATICFSTAVVYTLCLSYHLI